MGGTLALLLASHKQPQAVITLAAPVKLHRPDAKLLPSISWALRYWPTKKSEAKVYQEHGFFYYPYRPLKCVTSLFDLMEVTIKRLPLVKAPLLAIIGLKDLRVNKENLDLILNQVSSKIKKGVVFPNSPHYLHYGPDKDKVITEIKLFINEIINC